MSQPIMHDPASEFWQGTPSTVVLNPLGNDWYYIQDAENSQGKNTWAAPAHKPRVNPTDIENAGREKSRSLGSLEVISTEILLGGMNPCFATVTSKALAIHFSAANVDWFSTDTKGTSEESGLLY